MERGIKISCKLWGFDLSSPVSELTFLVGVDNFLFIQMKEVFYTWHLFSALVCYVFRGQKTAEQSRVENPEIYVKAGHDLSKEERSPIIAMSYLPQISKHIFKPT